MGVEKVFYIFNCSIFYMFGYFFNGGLVVGVDFVGYVGNMVLYIFVRFVEVGFFEFFEYYFVLYF